MSLERRWCRGWCGDKWLLDPGQIHDDSPAAAAEGALAAPSLMAVTLLSRSSSCPPDSTALPSMGCVTHSSVQYSVHSAPGEPSLSQSLSVLHISLSMWHHTAQPSPGPRHLGHTHPEHIYVVITTYLVATILELQPTAVSHTVRHNGHHAIGVYACVLL